MSRKRQTSNENLKFLDTPNDVPQKKNKNCCQNCLDIKFYIDNSFKKQTETLQEQNVKIMEALASQNILINMLIRQEQTSVQLTSSFPLATEESLIEIDKKINTETKHAYVIAIKDILRNNICKNIGLIIKEELVYDFNIDGTHGKKRLKDYNNLYDAIKEAVGANTGIDDIESNIRKVINLVKKRHLKQILKDRKDNNIEN